MEESEKRQLINDLCDYLKLEAQKRIRNKGFPDDWQGVEIRNWICDIYCECFLIPMSKSQKQEYENTRIVNNL